MESVENRRNWLACLEFSYTDRFGENSSEAPDDCFSEDSLWSRLLPRISNSPRLTELVRGLEDESNSTERPVWSGVPNPSSELSPRNGIPHSIRAQIWPRLTRAYELQQASLNNSSKRSPRTYAEIIRYSASLSPRIAQQIEKV